MAALAAAVEWVVQTPLGIRQEALAALAAAVAEVVTTAALAALAEVVAALFLEPQQETAAPAS